MVAIREVRASNSAFKTVEKSQVAVFVGATSGIGAGTLKHYVKNTHAPTVFITGRSKTAFAPKLQALAASNPEAKLNFIETEISFIRNVDTVCASILSQTRRIDVLFMSAGYITFDGRDETSEGIDVSMAVRYYSRMRFVDRLMPALEASEVGARVVAILAGGQETTLDFDDLEMKKNFKPFGAAENGATQTTLAFEHLAKLHPKVTFIHKYPGIVNTGLFERYLGSSRGLMSIPAMIARWTIVPLVTLFITTQDEAGERGVFISTSDRFSPTKVWLLGATDDVQPDVPVMTEYRANASDVKVWESTNQVWKRALGEAAQ